MTTTPLLLITADPSHPLAHLALRYARAYLKSASADHNIDSHADDIVNKEGIDNPITKRPLLNVFF
ncbi:hypothetical protein MGSAQ_000428 [marine sediment metagenome]